MVRRRSLFCGASPQVGLASPASRRPRAGACMPPEATLDFAEEFGRSICAQHSLATRGDSAQVLAYISQAASHCKLRRIGTVQDENTTPWHVMLLVRMYTVSCTPRKHKHVICARPAGRSAYDRLMRPPPRPPRRSPPARARGRRRGRAPRRCGSRHPGRPGSRGWPAGS